MSDRALADKIQQVLEEGSISFESKGTSFLLVCPRCNKEKLAIRKSDGWYICWYCNEKEGMQGRAPYILGMLTHRPAKQIAEFLLGHLVPNMDEYDELVLSKYGEPDELEEDEDFLYQEVYWGPETYTLDHKHAGMGVKYLESTEAEGRALGFNNGREIPREIAMQYGIRYCPPTGRVMFPVEVDGRLLGWQGRYIWPETEEGEDGKLIEIPKILSNRELSGVRSNVLMFQDRLKGSEHAFLSEGPVDAVKGHLCGGNVCSMGKKVTPAQLKVILDHGVKRLYLGLDPDAMEMTTWIVRELYSEVEIRVLPIPFKAPDGSKNDLGKMSFEAVRDCFNRAVKAHPAMLF